MENESGGTLIELLFRRHIRSVSDRKGECNARHYAKAVDERLRSVLWILFGSAMLLVIMIIGLVGLKEETLSNFLLLGILILVYSVIHLLGIKNAGEETMYDEELTRKWKSISLYTSIFGISCGLLSLYMMFSRFDISFGFGQEEEQTEERTEERRGAYNVEYEKLGININIPEGWSEPQWEYKSEPSVKRPQYRFNINDPDHTLWFYVYGWSTPPQYDILDFIPDWEKYIPSYLDDRIIEEIKTVELNGMQVLSVVGKRKDHPDFIYVCYRALHCSSMFHYTYRFRKTLHYKEELARAEKIFRMIDFTDVDVPVYRPNEDTRPVDWSFNGGCLDIMSARIRLMIPQDENIRWKTNNRSQYVFDVIRKGYAVGFDLKVVYTSEIAEIYEFVDEFEGRMNRTMTAGYDVEPCVKNLKNVKALYAAGRNDEAPAEVRICYEIIHKGARLRVEASVPSDRNMRTEKKAMQDLVEEIEFY